MKHFVFAIVISLGALNAPSAIAAPDAKMISWVMETTVDQVIIPAYENFDQAVRQLKQQTTSLCQSPGKPSLTDARNAFSKTVIAWGGIEFLRSGPVMKNNRLERVLFYPDRKSTGLKQVQRVLANEDASATSIERLKKKSVAVQGLGALEFLLFGTGSDVLSATGETFRCKFADTIATNLQDISAELVNAWKAEDGVKAQWKNPGNPNSVFRTDLEAVNELLGTAVHGLEAVRDIRLGAFLRKAPPSDRPKSALLWRSNNTIPAMIANVEMVAKLFETGGMDEMISNDEFGVINSIKFELSQVLSAMRAIDKPINLALKDADQREKLEYLKLALGFLLKRVDTEYANAAGLASGFSFSDGD